MAAQRALGQQPGAGAAARPLPPPRGDHRRSARPRSRAGHRVGHDRHQRAGFAAAPLAHPRDPHRGLRADHRLAGDLRRNDLRGLVPGAGPGTRHLHRPDRDQLRHRRAGGGRGVTPAAAARRRRRPGDGPRLRLGAGGRRRHPRAGRPRHPVRRLAPADRHSGGAGGPGCDGRRVPASRTAAGRVPDPRTSGGRQAPPGQPPATARRVGAEIRRRHRMNRDKRTAIYGRLRDANPHPATELEYSTPFELLVAVILSAQATDVGVNKATRRLFPVADTPADILALGVDGLSRYIRTIGLYNSKAKNIIETSDPARGTRGRGAPGPGGAGSPARRRPQDRERDPEYGFRRARDRSGYPHLPRGQSYRAGQRQDAAGGRETAEPADAAGVPERRPSLADPARALRLQGAQAGLPELRHRRPLRVPPQDRVAGGGLMLFGRDRDDLRRMYADAWRKAGESRPMSPLEAQIADVVAAHPEYHVALAESGLGQDYTGVDGTANPFLHMGLHMALREQVATDRPAGVRSVFESLAARLGDAHEAEHRMIECLAEALWEAQRAGTAPDESAYLERLRRLT